MCKNEITCTYKDYSNELNQYVAKEGIFLGFGVDYDEFDSGPANYSVALIKENDGQIRMIYAGHVQLNN